MRWMINDFDHDHLKLIYHICSEVRMSNNIDHDYPKFICLVPIHKGVYRNTLNNRNTLKTSAYTGIRRGV